MLTNKRENYIILFSQSAIELQLVSFGEYKDCWKSWIHHWVGTSTQNNWVRSPNYIIFFISSVSTSSSSLSRSFATSSQISIFLPCSSSSCSFLLNSTRCFIESCSTTATPTQSPQTLTRVLTRALNEKRICISFKWILNGNRVIPVARLDPFLKWQNKKLFTVYLVVLWPFNVILINNITYRGGSSGNSRKASSASRPILCTRIM